VPLYLSSRGICRYLRRRSAGAGFVGEHDAPEISGEVSLERTGGVARRCAVGDLLVVVGGRRWQTSGSGSSRWCRSRSSVAGPRSGTAGAGTSQRSRSGWVWCRCSSRTRRPRRTCSQGRCGPADGRRGPSPTTSTSRSLVPCSSSSTAIFAALAPSCSSKRRTSAMSSLASSTRIRSGPARARNPRSALVALAGVSAVGAPPANNSRSNACEWLTARVLLGTG
jgi:hypothetical protein